MRGRRIITKSNSFYLILCFIGSGSVPGRISAHIQEVLSFHISIFSFLLSQVGDDPLHPLAVVSSPSLHPPLPTPPYFRTWMESLSDVSSTLTETSDPSDATSEPPTLPPSPSPIPALGSRENPFPGYGVSPFPWTAARESPRNPPSTAEPSDNSNNHFFLSLTRHYCICGAPCSRELPVAGFRLHQSLRPSATPQRSFADPPVEPEEPHLNHIFRNYPELHLPDPRCSSRDPTHTIQHSVPALPDRP